MSEERIVFNAFSNDWNEYNPPSYMLNGQTFSEGCRFAKIDFKDGDMNISNPNGTTTNEGSHTFPILSNLLQPDRNVTSVKNVIKANEVIHNQQDSSGTGYIKTEHDYVKDPEPKKQPRGSVYLTINLAKYAKEINVEDICGVVLLLKNPVPPTGNNNVNIPSPCETVEEDNTNETFVPLTETTVETKPEKNSTENGEKEAEYFNCTHCEGGFFSKKNLKHHLRRNHGIGVKHKCPTCSKCFTTRTFLKRHREKNHFNSCDYCDGAFENIIDFKNHIKETHKDVHYRMCKPYFCEVCSTTFGIKSVFLTHLRTHGGVVCGVCAERLSTKKEFNAHRDTHPDEHFCPKCNKGFKLKESLKAHEETHNEYQFICTQCKKGFKTKSTLKCHMLSHIVKRNYMCDQCSKMFRSPIHLKKHYNSVHSGIKNYRCPHCEKRFYSKNYLQVHIDIMHLKLKPYQCEYCGKRFARKDYVVNHSKIHQKPETSDATGKTGQLRKRFKKKFAAPPGEEPPRVVCPICGRTYKIPENLKIHLKYTHARIRKFKCSYCGLMFLHKTTLTRHEKVHKAEPDKFICPVCRKRLDSKDEFDAHLEEHNKVPKKHSCDTCGEAFARRFLLDNHVYQQHFSEEDLQKQEMEVMETFEKALFYESD